MSNYSWDIVNPADLFEMLKLDFKEFKSEPLSERKALHCILTCWHLTDWTFEVFEKDNFENIGEFRDSLYPNCNELKIMHDITTRLKHFKIGRPKSDLSDSKKNKGLFNRDFNFDLDVSCLKISHDKKEVCIDLTLEKVIIFWQSYFNEKE